MITPEYCRAMARYNAWQNNGLRSVVQFLSEDELRADRGAFFGSILATLNHLLWGDRIWMSRFDGGEAPPGGIADSVDLTSTPAIWAAERFRTDGRISEWARQLDAVDLVGDLSFESMALGRVVRKPFSFCITHFYIEATCCGIT